MRVVLLCVCVVFLGCGRTGSRTTPAVQTAIPPDPVIPNPDPVRMSFDAESRTLTLYALPKSGEWIVRHESGTKYPVKDLECQIPPGADPTKVEIHYFLPGIRPSHAIRLHNVIAAHAPSPEP